MYSIISTTVYMYSNGIMVINFIRICSMESMVDATDGRHWHQLELRAWVPQPCRKVATLIVLPGGGQVDSDTGACLILPGPPWNQLDGANDMVYIVELDILFSNPIAKIKWKGYKKTHWSVLVLTKFNCLCTTALKQRSNGQYSSLKGGILEIATITSLSLVLNQEINQSSLLTWSPYSRHGWWGRKKRNERGIRRKWMAEHWD